jgi:hypothetical protein
MNSLLVIIFGLFLFVASFFALLVTLNYMIFSWEKNKISHISRRLNNPDIIDNPKNSFASRYNFGTMTQSVSQFKPAKAFGNMYNSTISHLPDPKIYPSWMTKYTVISLEFATKIYDEIKKIILYLVSLTKPVKTQDHAYVHHNDDKAEEVHMQIEEGLQPNPATEVKIHMEEAEEEIEKLDMIDETPQFKPIQTDATIGMKAEGKEDEKGVFDKLETKLLEKLQSSDMSNYDIWLELGDLYAKYHEDKKAMEIYALVLKNSTDDHQKSLATNKMIGL